MASPTTYFAFQKPAVNNPTDQDQWGGYLNTDLDSLDNIIKGLYSSKANDYTVLPADVTKMFVADCSGNTVNFTLPTTGITAGVYYGFKKIDSSANTMTVTGTIDGATNFVTANQYDAIIIQYNGSTWNVIGSNLKLSTPVFSKYFTSDTSNPSGLTITNLSTLTIPHGFAIEPKVIRVTLKCVTNDTATGRVVGSKTTLAPSAYDSFGAGNFGIFVDYDATNIYLGTAQGVKILANSTGSPNPYSAATINNANFKYVVEAEA